MKRGWTWASLVAGVVGGVMLSGSPVEASDVPTATSITYCADYDGTACSPPGTKFRCYNQYPYEPGICFCTSSGTWMCG